MPLSNIINISSFAPFLLKSIFISHGCGFASKLGKAYLSEFETNSFIINPHGTAVSILIKTSFIFISNLDK